MQCYLSDHGINYDCLAQDYGKAYALRGEDVQEHSTFSRLSLSSIVNGTNDSLAGIMLYTVLTVSYELDIQTDVKYTVERKQRELEYLEKMLIIHSETTTPCPYLDMVFF